MHPLNKCVIQVFHMEDLNAGKIPDWFETIYCGRDKDGRVPQFAGKKGWLGNPYKVHGKVTRRDAVASFRGYLDTRLDLDGQFKLEFEKLAGRSLALVCFCAPKLCHCHYIKKVLDDWNNEDAKKRERAVS